MPQLTAFLRSRRDFIGKVMDASQNGVYVHDLARRVNVFVNAEYSRLTGYTPEQLRVLAGQDFLDLFHPEDWPRIAGHLAALKDAADGDVLEIEYRFRHREGDWIWCLSRQSVFERDRQGEVRSIIGTLLDISERKRSEAALRLSEATAHQHLAELAAIYDGAPIGLCTLDRDLRFVRVNRRLSEINGIPASEHIGKRVAEVIPGLTEVESRLRRVIETGEPALDIEISGETAGRPGVRRTWIESWLPLNDAEGRVTGVNIVADEITDERAALDALATSRELYRLVADYTYAWEYWAGPDGRLRWVSPSCERISGYPPAAFLADPGLMERIVHPEDAALFRQHRHIDFRLGEPQRLRFRILRPDGEIRWIEHLCHPVFSSDQFAGRRASNRDITEAKTAEESLRRSEREFAALVENSPDIIARFDRSLRHLFVNAAVEPVTGLSAGQFLGRTNEEMGLPPALCAGLSAMLEEVFRSGEPRSIDLPYRGPAGERFFSVRAVPELGPDGSVETVLSTARDETVRREAQARAETLAAVVEASGDLVGVVALDGQVIYLNRAGQALVGLDGDAAVNAKVEDFVFPEDLPFVRQSVMPAVMEEGRWIGDFRFRHFGTGESIDVHCDLVRIDDPEIGRPLQFATVTRDIRREKSAERALHEASRRKDEFLTVLGHELRNPMAPIRNAVEILRMLKISEDPRAQWALQVLDRQTAHMSRLLDDLLDVSRIVRGKLKLQRVRVELREVLREAAEGVRPLVEERGQRLDVELPAPGVSVDGDPVRLSQILLNLLLNAANYTQEGGQISLFAGCDGDQAIIRVSDNGPGIPPDRLEELFTPFSQGEQQDGRASPGGLGLGLTISRRLAELHGGELQASSAWPAPGSTFTLKLPRLATEETQAQASHGPAPGGETPALRILVVDDNADVAGALAMLLVVLGYQVQTAASGAEALAVAQWQRPRVALVDIGLPDMDGLELAGRLRELVPERDRLTLVAVTGYGHDEARQRSFAAGFDEHLAKPVNRETLQALLAGLDQWRAGGSDAPASGPAAPRAPFK